MSSLRSEPGVVFTPAPCAARLAAGLKTAPPTAAVLDPACGDGELLLAALEHLPWRPRALFGIELDAEHATRARARLDAALATLPPSERPRVSIECADALDPERPWPAGAAVLANPPWISYSGRQRAPLPAERLARYLRAWPSMRAWPSSHAAFLERIAIHVAAGEGVTARVLLPASMLELDRYAPVRQAVTRTCRLDGPPEELGESAFPGVVEPACLLTLARAPRRGPGTAQPWSALARNEAALLDHLRSFPRLPPACFGDPGVHTGNASRDLILRAPASASTPIRVGRDLTPFALAPPTRHLCTDLERTGDRYFRIAPLARYAAVPILLRQTAARPIAALHTEPTYFRNTLLACTPPPDLDPAFVVGVLNSSAAATWHRLNFRDARQRTFPQVKVGHLRTLPFPIARRADDPALHDAIAERVRASNPADASFEAAYRELDELVSSALLPD